MSSFSVLSITVISVSKQKNKKQNKIKIIFLFSFYTFIGVCSSSDDCEEIDFVIKYVLN